MLIPFAMVVGTVLFNDILDSGDTPFHKAIGLVEIRTARSVLNSCVTQEFFYVLAHEPEPWSETILNGQPNVFITFSLMNSVMYAAAVDFIACVSTKHVVVINTNDYELVSISGFRKWSDMVNGNSCERFSWYWTRM